MRFKRVFFLIWPFLAIKCLFVDCTYRRANSDLPTHPNSSSPPREKAINRTSSTVNQKDVEEVQKRIQQFIESNKGVNADQSAGQSSSLNDQNLSDSEPSLDGSEEIVTPADSQTSDESSGQGNNQNCGEQSQQIPCLRPLKPGRYSAQSYGETRARLKPNLQIGEQQRNANFSYNNQMSMNGRQNIGQTNRQIPSYRPISTRGQIVPYQPQQKRPEQSVNEIARIYSKHIEGQSKALQRTKTMRAEAELRRMESSGRSDQAEIVAKPKIGKMTQIKRIVMPKSFGKEHWKKKQNPMPKAPQLPMLQYHPAWHSNEYEASSSRRWDENENIEQSADDQQQQNNHSVAGQTDFGNYRYLDTLLDEVQLEEANEHKRAMERERQETEYQWS